MQHRALLAYLGLTAIRENWSGCLVLLQASSLATPFAYAANAAGAAVLWTSPSLDALREDGLTDFNVTNLAEAIRILKNEIRKGRPVIVGLHDPGITVWKEAALRGLQPEACFSTEGLSAEQQTILLERGATDLHTVLANESTAERRIQTNTAKTWRERKQQDDAILRVLQKLDESQRAHAVRWLHAANHLFPRDLHRCLFADWGVPGEP